MTDFHVQFGPATTTPADGYVVDSGLPFAESGEMQFGWDRRKAAAPKLLRDASVDIRHNAFVQPKRGATWEMAIPNGDYVVRVVAGDANSKRGNYGFDVEGLPALRGEVTAQHRWLEAIVNVNVIDGRLTIHSPMEFRKNRLNFIDVTHIEAAPGSSTPGRVSEPVSPSTSSVPTGLGELSLWQTGAPSPIERAEAVGVAVGGKLYVFGGIDGPGSNYSFPVTRRADVYDPVADTWHRLADMPEAFTHNVASVDGAKIWFVGGFVGHTPAPGTTHVWKYDTVADAWARGPDLPSARGGGASAIVGRTLHYFGGANENRTQDMATHWSLNLDTPSATWESRADMPIPRNHMAAATVDGMIYAVGGQRGEGDEAVDVADVEVYDPATDTWATVASMPGSRSHTNSSTLELNGKLIVMGGESGPEEYADEILAYDPGSNAWSVLGYLPDPRSTAIAGIIDEKLVFATGNAPGISDDTWIAQLTP